MKNVCVRCFVVAVLAFTTEHAAAQTREMQPNDVGIELLGKAVLTSISYQRVLTPAFGLHVGVGGLVGDFDAILCVPVGGTVYLASNTNALFLTGGVVGTSEDIGALPMYGYIGGGFEFRFASGFVLRGTLYGLILDDEDFPVVPVPGLSVGYAF